MAVPTCAKAQVSDLRKSSPSWSLVCGECGKLASRIDDLGRHMVSHTRPDSNYSDGPTTDTPTSPLSIPLLLMEQRVAVHLMT